ncbi:ABC transporter permease [Nesterenkonia cremea]|uniref:ABC transporter permease n=1 Tax=Nesterenkonia cremea TaxID=1882340 RepID=A0A917ALX1_9MICC|nr:ABC transporter permease [Nesterenkonia cremea]GGE60260.1 ABC transporter permease [Nesterenkonia cremea]
MYLALREVRFARGRFALMGAVVALITLLLVMLTGLTSGLARQNIAAIDSLPADRIVFGDDERDPSYTESSVDAEQLEAWQQAANVSHAEPLGISQTTAESETALSVAVFGLAEDSVMGPEGGAAPSAGETVISEEISEDLGLTVGDSVTVNGQELTVSAVAPTQWYSHTPVMWTALTQWQELSPRGDPDAVGTVLAVTLQDDAVPTLDGQDVDDVAGTWSMTPTESFDALASYSSENGSLTLMQVMLYLISALVIAAFLTVWTIQRTRDIAVLKALGASTGYVLRDSLAEAALVLFLGASIGGLAGWAGGLAASGAAPVELTVLTTLAPAAGVLLTGLAAAVLAVRRVTRVDPLLALGGS